MEEQSNIHHIIFLSEMTGLIPPLIVQGQYTQIYSNCKGKYWFYYNYKHIHIETIVNKHILKQKVLLIYR